MINNDTIFALSSGLGISGVYVIRISGNNLYNIAEKIINKKNIKPRYAYFTNLKDENNLLIDSCLIIYFKSPNSFTGEDIIEIHSHGSIAIKNKIFNYLTFLNMRMAEPGEFSKRAFLNNKINLVEADGLISLLKSKTEQQRIYAINTLSGLHNDKYINWRNEIIEILAYSNAIIDYPEDELPLNINNKIFDKTQKLLNEIKSLISSYKISNSIQNGFNVVLTGKTNVGKSSIFNKIAGESLAIVSDIEGTTRDILTIELNINGFLVRLKDTAGIRESSDTIEKIGIENTNLAVNNADLVIRVFDINDKVLIKPKQNEIFVYNKADTVKNSNKEILISAKTGLGIDNLLNAITQKIQKLTENIESKTIITDRIKNLLEKTIFELNKGLSNYNKDLLIFGEHIRIASEYIGQIMGEIHPEEVINTTFSQLCLGK